MSLHLEVLSGPDRGKVFPCGAGPVRVGRGEGVEVRLTDPAVSRLHCRLTFGAGVTVTDADSRGGTFVNGERVREAALAGGDVVRVGGTTFAVRAAAPAAPPEPAPAPDAPLPGVKFTGKARAGGLPALPGERLEQLAGHTLGDYHVEQVLARGQSGVVFLGTDLRHRQPVALKVLWPEVSGDERSVQRFVRAMKTMLPLRHPHLVAVHGAGKTGPYCWVAMELVPGRGLSGLLAEAGPGAPLDWRLALRVAVHVARGLAFAHRHGIVHRGVSPPNVLVSSVDGAAKLGDVMLAKATAGKLAEDITTQGQLLGNFRFLSPEATTGLAAEVDARSDVYGLGATAYLMLTGRPPVEGRSLVEILLKVRREEPPPPRELAPGVPEGLERAVLKMLAKDPAGRFQTAGELLAELTPLARAWSVPV